MSWYEARWVLEKDFRLLKAGTRVQDRWLRGADGLGRYLAFPATTTWRVFALYRYARDEPATPAGEVLSGDEQ